MRARPAELDDFDIVTSLLELLERDKVTPATRERCRTIYAAQLEDQNATHLVAEDRGGAVIGFCSLHFRTRLNYSTQQAWVPDLVVAEGSRRHGIGRMLLDEALRLAEVRGCFELVLESGYRRAEAHHLYRQAGMRDAGKYFRKPVGARE